jgi:folate-dependent phosphoribosylglycinamide formyltransferase PurN
MPISAVKSLVGRLWDARVWRPEHARLLLSQLVYRARNADARFTDQDHLMAAVRWLAGAQDVTPDGGVCGRYRLDGGWTSTYPETTGYIVPTFLALADHLGDGTFRDRARRAVDCLLALQLPMGAFPGGEVHENRDQPSVFNTAQILTGLTAWWRATNDDKTLQAARRAADWLVQTQDPDGAWRKHIYRGVATTYSAHASCWLAEFGATTESPRYLEAAARHLDWVLQQHDASTGWFDLAGFTPEAHAARQAYTHTIAYTLWGVLLSSEILNRPDGIAAVERAAVRIARTLELGRRLPGILDSSWRAAERARFACLTGNVQMTLIWWRLYRRNHEPILLNAGLKALDLVKRAQPMFARDPGIRGGIPGSDPVWGEYLYNAVPNWSAKFFIDALLEKEQLLAEIASRPRGRHQLAADVRSSVAVPSSRAAIATARVVMLTSQDSHKVAQMATAWGPWGFRPSAVVIERRSAPSFVERLRRRLRERGFSVGGGRDGTSGAPAAWPNPTTYCATHEIPTFEVDSLSDPASVALVASLKPDLAIHAGAGILRAPLLAVPRLGTLNAHMGALPYYRGMNVSEWARFNGDPIACTVHLVDHGIDTGPIVCVSPVDGRAATSIAELREVVDRAQIALLGEVVRYVVETNALPPLRPQREDEGVQFFRMHAELALVLESELRKS